jgi:hypothetical protein
MRRAGPKPGVLIAADPATVERSGFAIRESRCFRTVRIRGGGRGGPTGKATGVVSRSAGAGRLYNLRIVHLFVISADCGHAIWRKNSGKARRTRSCPRVRGAVSQETCHPQGHRARSRERYSRCQHGGCHGFIIPFPERFISRCRDCRFARRSDSLPCLCALRPGPFHDIDTVRQCAGSGWRPFRQIRLRRETCQGVGS